MSSNLEVAVDAARVTEMLIKSSRNQLFNQNATIIVNRINCEFGINNKLFCK